MKLIKRRKTGNVVLLYTDEQLHYTRLSRVNSIQAIHLKVLYTFVLSTNGFIWAFSRTNWRRYLYATYSLFLKNKISHKNAKPISCPQILIYNPIIRAAEKCA